MVPIKRGKRGERRGSFKNLSTEEGRLYRQPLSGHTLPLLRKGRCSNTTTQGQGGKKGTGNINTNKDRGKRNPHRILTFYYDRFGS